MSLNFGMHLALSTSKKKAETQGGTNMLWTIIIVLLVLWALGFGFAGSAIGGLIHLLLVLALVLLVVQLLTGRRGAI